MMSLALFWGAALLLAYTYGLFPVLVFLRGWLLPRPYQSADIAPSVSMIIAAYNEAENIETKLQNILSLDYPHDRLEVVIASDGSTDGTDAIVSRYADKGVRLLSLPRQGKIPALNTAVGAANGEILVFSDANSMYVPDALSSLVRPFADPEVGGVAGDQRYVAKRRVGITADGERGYWDFDRKLKRSQSRAGNAVSATGAIYAIRHSLFRPIPMGVTDDFVASTAVIAQGYRLVMAPDAIAYEAVADSSGAEFQRKVRVITQGMRSVQVMRELLNPFRYGFYALQLFSHKVLRRLMVFPLLVLFIASSLLLGRGVFYKLAALTQIAFYSCALVGFFFGKTRFGRLKIFTMPFFFCMVNAASLVATLNMLRGRRIDRWETGRLHLGAPTTPDGVSRFSTNSTSNHKSGASN
jgi:cellulose synthase/poly-beta-1,6-N-acetylglucosamine synthase-like glycosyltransferase